MGQLISRQELVPVVPVDKVEARVSVGVVLVLDVPHIPALFLPTPTIDVHPDPFPVGKCQIITI